MGDISLADVARALDAMLDDQMTGQARIAAHLVAAAEAVGQLPGVQPQASAFYPLLSSAPESDDVVAQGTQVREIDNEIFKYVGVAASTGGESCRWATRSPSRSSRSGAVCIRRRS